MSTQTLFSGEPKEQLIMKWLRSWNDGGGAYPPEYPDAELPNTLLGRTLFACETEEELEKVWMMARDIERLGFSVFGPDEKERRDAVAIWAANHGYMLA